MSHRFVPANRSLSCFRERKDDTKLLFPYRQAVPSLPPRARLAKRKASLLIPALTPPNPHADAKGASLFVPDSSRAFLSCPRTMHEEIRTGPPYGYAGWYCQKCTAANNRRVNLVFSNHYEEAPRTIRGARLRCCFFMPDWRLMQSGGVWTVRMEGS